MNLFANLDWIWRSNRSYALRYSLLFAGGVFIHIVLCLIFASYGVWYFFWSNLITALLYLVWGHFFANYKLTDYLVYFPYADVLLHSCFFNLFLGGECAFYLYTFAMIPVIFSFPVRDFHARNTVISSFAVSVFSILAMLLTLFIPPFAPLPAEAVKVCFQTNLMLSFSIITVFTWEYLYDTLHTQTHLTHIAEYDQLTGLRNRYSLNKYADTLRGTQYCVIMSDVDDFKLVNDNFGHSVGDRLLMEIGRVLHDCLRKDDVVCRWGGEEFLIVVRADLDTAHSVADRIRYRLSLINIGTDEEPIGATMTFGIADCMEGDGFESVTLIADANLIRGKEAGKNRIVMSSDIMDGSGTQDSFLDSIDTSSLRGSIFSAFAETSDTTYIYLCDLSANVSRWSKTAVDYFGLPGEYMYDAGKIWLGYIHPDDRHIYEDDINAVFSGKKNVHNCTYRARNKNGEYVLCSCKGVVNEATAVYPRMFAGTITNLGVVGSDYNKGRHHAI